MENIKAIVVNGPNGQQEYGIEDAEARENVQEIVEGAPEELNTFKEAFDAFKEGSDALEQITEAQQANTKAIADEAKRATEAERAINASVTEAAQAQATALAQATTALWGAIATEKTRAEGAEKTNADAIVEAREHADAKINEEKERAEKHLADEVEKIKDGDTIVGQAREIHSRNGKTVTDSFLARTTAGSGTIGDGVATLKSVGGNIVKNLVDSTFESGWSTGNSTVAINSGIIACTTSATYGRYAFTVNLISGHKYYISVLVNGFGKLVQAVVSRSYNANAETRNNGWTRISYVTNTDLSSTFYITCATNEHTFYVTKPLLVDLTEMFGDGKEPTKEECDRMFGTMDALPQGLSIANPTEFKSIGFNQFNPDNVLEGKAIVDNAIESGDKKIAVVPCLPCKVGTGENNGYCVHGEFEDSDIKVYLTPLNPMEVEGELYMHELTPDATKGTYVPLIKGYMLVEVPTTANLCAHFLWSEDKCERDSYEPYFESKIELPDIPQMSEWGLAGIGASGTFVADTINLEHMTYTTRIGGIDLGSLDWAIVDYNQCPCFRAWVTGGMMHKESTLGNSVLQGYTQKEKFANLQQIEDKVYVFNSLSHSPNTLAIRDSRYADVASFKASLDGVMFYYELGTSKEYPLPKVDNNYISSDYGVEQFDSVVPCNANNLYYMRSLAGETRNFLDRLMAGLGTSDATVVADRILAVVNPAVEPANVEPETRIEE